jgi:hypothetical protein
MTVLRTQGIERLSVTAINAAFTTFDVPRPETTPKEPAYAENSDHVVAPVALREYEGGHCVVELGTNLTAANVFLDKVEIVKLLPTPQKGVAGPGGALFPSGAPSDETLVRVLLDRGQANDLPTDAEAVLGFLGQANFSNTVRSYPGITLRSGEFVRITLGNTSGGDLTDAVTATYKFGLNQRDTGKP